MRILGLDFGTKRIGVAMSDELMLTAQGMDTIQRRDTRSDVEAIAKIVADNGVTEVVVGLPINMDGTEGAKVREVSEFVDNLAKSVKVPIVTKDERLTTVQAERTLLEADMSRSRRKGLRDMLAAQLILQSYLDSRRRGNARDRI